MPKVNKSRYAILGILGYGPHSGYDIKKVTDVSARHFWAESYGHLYATLRKLESEGLVTMIEQEQEGKPDKKLYAISEAGLEAFRRWLEEPAEPAPVRNEFLLKLFFGRQAPPEANRRHLEHFRERQQQRIEAYQGLESWLKSEHAGEADLPYWLMTLPYGRHDAMALLRWSDESLELLERRTDIGTTEETT